MKMLPLLALAFLVGLSGCTMRNGEPIGVGTNADALKLSPCACIPASQPGWDA